MQLNCLQPPEQVPIVYKSYCLIFYHCTADVRFILLILCVERHGTLPAPLRGKFLYLAQTSLFFFKEAMSDDISCEIRVACSFAKFAHRLKSTRDNNYFQVSLSYDMLAFIGKLWTYSYYTWRGLYYFKIFG